MAFNRQDTSTYFDMIPFLERRFVNAIIKVQFV
jgi:hypothetical protein